MVDRLAKAELRWYFALVDLLNGIDLNESLGLLETIGFTPAIAALDVMEKTAGVRLWQLEINDRLGVCAKILGLPADLESAITAGYRVAKQMGGRPVSQVINRPDQTAWQAIGSPAEYNPLIQQDVVHVPHVTSSQRRDHQKESHLDSAPSFALGLIETQGFTAVFSAIDTACKAANVEVVGKEKLGGGYVTVVIKGDVAAVKAAIDAGRPQIEGLGTLIAAHVIARPSPSVLSLLPKMA